MIDKKVDVSNMLDDNLNISNFLKFNDDEEKELENCQNNSFYVLNERNNKKIELSKKLKSKERENKTDKDINAEQIKSIENQLKNKIIEKSKKKKFKYADKYKINKDNNDLENKSMEISSKKMADIEKENNELKKQIEKNMNELSQCKNEINSKDQKLKEQNDQLIVKEKENNDYKNKIDELRLSNKDILNQISKNNKGEEQNNQIISKMKKENEELQRQKIQLEKENKTIKEEYLKILEEKYKKIISEKLSEIQIQFNQELAKKNDDLKNKVEQKYKKKDIDLNKKFNEMSQLIINKSHAGKDNNFSIFLDNNNDHINDNLNGNNDDNYNNNNNNNNINNNIDEQDLNKQYSYERINNLNLAIYIYEGTEKEELKIDLKNNGIKEWPYGKTKLVFDKKCKVIADDIFLEPQKPGENKQYNVIFKDLKNCPVGTYYSYLDFNINGQNIGDRLSIIINIKERQQNEINEHIDQIKEFRENFDLNDNDYSDQQLFEALKNNEFDYDAAFASLF